MDRKQSGLIFFAIVSFLLYAFGVQLFEGVWSFPSIRKVPLMVIALVGTGIFATEKVGGAKGLIEGSSSLLIENIIMIVATFVYSLVVSLIILKILDVIPGLGLRSTESEEDAGLDISDHGERAFIEDGAD